MQAGAGGVSGQSRHVRLAEWIARGSYPASSASEVAVPGGKGVQRLCRQPRSARRAPSGRHQQTGRATEGLAWRRTLDWGTAPR